MCNPPFYDDDEYQATVAEHEEMGEDQHAGRYAQDTQIFISTNSVKEDFYSYHRTISVTFE